MVKVNDMYLIDVDSSVDTADKVGYVDHTVDTRFTTTGVKRIYMAVTSVRWNAGSFMQVPEAPRADITTLNSDLAYGDFIGVPNPTITIQGVIKLSDYDTSTGLSPLVTYNDGTEKEAYMISVKLLQQMWKTGDLFQLVDYYDYDEATSTPTTPIYRIHTLGTSDAIAKPNVRITALTFTSTSQIKEGDRINFSLTLKEVKDG